LLLWYSAVLKLLTGGKTNIEATLIGGWIGQKDAQGFQFAEPWRSIRIESLSYLIRYIGFYLIKPTTNRWT
jgi:hypothetical protein